MNLSTADTQQLRIPAGASASRVRPIGHAEATRWLEDTLYRGDGYEFPNALGLAEPNGRGDIVQKIYRFVQDATAGDSLDSPHVQFTQRRTMRRDGTQYSMSDSPILARYRIETCLPVEQVAEVIAGEQSSGTFLPVPGETEELKARSRAKVTNVTLLEAADTPSLPGGRKPKGTASRLKYQRAEISSMCSTTAICRGWAN